MAIRSQSESGGSAGSTTKADGPDRAMKLHERAATKRCNTCGEKKLLNQFENIRKKFLRNQCMRCRQNHANLRYAQIGVTRAARLRANKRWKDANPEKNRACDAKQHIAYYAKHKAEWLAKFIARRSLKERAVPRWADLKTIEALYLVARDLTERTGIKHEVDHIIPLKSEVVCGLHVESNLRVITRYDNRKKSNRLVEDIV